MTRRDRPNQADAVEGPTLHIDDDLLLEALAAVERRGAGASDQGPETTPDEIPIDLGEEEPDGAGGEITIQALTDDLVVSLDGDDTPASQEEPELPPWLQVPEDLLEPEPGAGAEAEADAYDEERTDPSGFVPRTEPLPPKPRKSASRPRSVLSDPKTLERISKMRRRIKKLQHRVSDLEAELDRERQSAHLARSRSRIAENSRVEAEEQRDNIDMFARSLRTRLLAQEEELARIQKRSSIELERARMFGADATIREILPVLDNLDLALAHADTDPKKFVPGVRMVAALFLRSLERVGVKAIEASPGTPFDPAVHEAILTLPSDEHPEGTVAEEVRRGYSLNERLLRASQVSVVGPPRRIRERVVPSATDDAGPDGTNDAGAEE